MKLQTICCKKKKSICGTDIKLTLLLCSWIFAVTQNNLFMIILERSTSVVFYAHLLSSLKKLILHDWGKNYTCLDWFLITNHFSRSTGSIKILSCEVKVLKTFKISSKCHMKTCQSLKWWAIFKIPGTIF